MLLFGTVNFVWFQKLKNSMPIWARTLSVRAVVLNSDKSVFQIAGPLNVFRPRPPYLITVPAALAGKVVNPVVVEKAAAFRYLPGARPAKGSPICVGLTTEQLQTTLNGNPERAD